MSESIDKLNRTQLRKGDVVSIQGEDGLWKVRGISSQGNVLFQSIEDNNKRKKLHASNVDKFTKIA